MKALRRTIAGLLVGPLLALGVPVPAQARVVGRDPARPDRARVERLVERALVEHGVDAVRAKARAAALTDEEAARIGAEIDKLPAGGGGGDPLELIFWIVVGVVALVVVLPIYLLVKLAKASSRSGDTGSGTDRAGDEAPGAQPDPQY